MGRAVWCDAKDAGHPVNEPDAIMVSGKAVTLFFCKGHCVPAFVTAFNTAPQRGQIRHSPAHTGTTVRVCDLPSWSRGSWWRCLELCLVVVPSGACLVASPPDAPRIAEGFARGRCEQPACFGHRHADQADVAGWFLAGAGGELAAVAPVFRLVSGTGAGLGRGGCARAGRGPGCGVGGWPGGRGGE